MISFLFSSGLYPEYEDVKFVQCQPTCRYDVILARIRPESLIKKDVLDQL